MSEAKSIIQKLQEPLKPEEVQIMSKMVRKISGTGKFKGLFLLHKSAQIVIDRFNEVCGLGWQDRYFVDENKDLCCEISVKDEKNEWIKRQGVGVAGNIEKAKSRYSDALKRASDKFGVGRELKYVAPIFIELNENEIEDDKGHISLSPFLNLKMWKISFKNNESGRIYDLQIYDEKGLKRWGK